MRNEVEDLNKMYGKTKFGDLEDKRHFPDKQGHRFKSFCPHLFESKQKTVVLVGPKR